MKTLGVLAACLLCSWSSPPRRESPMVANAKAFLKTLSPETRKAALRSFEDEQRMTWNYVPLARQGVSLGEMNAEQTNAAQALLKASVSQLGLEKLETIRKLESVLHELENGNPIRDPSKYWFIFFGEPSSTSPWGWRYEGHHASLSFTMIGDRVVATTPQFLGSNPAEVKSGPMKGTRVLAKEQDIAFRFMESLSSDQRKTAVVAQEAPKDIVTSNARKATLKDHLGISFGALTKTQQGLLLELLRAHAEVQTENERNRRIKDLQKDSIDQVVFAWMGPVERKGRHYYRIQGNSFIVEYDNTQDDGNHIHTVWRSINGDFAEDVLAEHYADSHHDPGHH